MHRLSLQWVGSIDLLANDDANVNVIVDSSSASWVDQNAAISKKLAEALGGGNKVDAILCVAGGWAGGNAASDGKFLAEPAFSISPCKSLIILKKIFLHIGYCSILSDMRRVVGAQGQVDKECLMNKKRKQILAPNGPNLVNAWGHLPHQPLVYTLLWIIYV